MAFMLPSHRSAGWVEGDRERQWSKQNTKFTSKKLAKNILGIQK